MANAIIPKFLFDEEDIYYLQDRGIKISEGNQVVGKYKIPCYKFFNLNENEVFDELEGNSLNEADITDSQKMSFANRSMSILFLKLRQVMNMQDKEQKIAATCSLIAAVNSLAVINLNYAKRFLPILRGLA